MLATLFIALAINVVGFLIAYSFQTDKLTDAAYAVTFIGILLISVTSNNMNSVAWIVAGLILLWAIRLGTYLIIRINNFGRDKRFDSIRDNFFKYGGFWILQALTAWVVCLPAILLFYSDTLNIQATTITFVGAGIALSGILIEAIADGQKYRFLKEKKNSGKWIESGLWRLSRHPNYFGEIVMWIGIYLIVIEWLTRPTLYLAALGPATIIFMLLFVSGVPPLEKAADKKWGNNKRYIRYRDNTSVIIPMLPKKE